MDLGVRRDDGEDISRRGRWMCTPSCSLDRPPECATLFSDRLKNRQIRENDVKPKETRARTWAGTRALALAVAASIGLIYAAAPARAQEKITVWWGKGFYK